MVAARKRKDHPGEEVRRRHLDFIQANVELLSASAFEGFLEDGPGFVVLDDGVFIKKPIPEIVKFQCLYMAEGNEVFKEAGGKWPGKKEAGWVTEYDPKTTLLVCFVRTDGGMSSYKVSGFGSGVPEMAYQRRRAGRN